MRLIFDQIDKVEYLEIILTPKEIKKMAAKGCVAEFPQALTKGKVLNVFLRQENLTDILTEEEEDYAFGKDEEMGLLL